MIALQCLTFNAFIMLEGQQPIWGKPHMFCVGAEICNSMYDHRN